MAQLSVLITSAFCEKQTEFSTEHFRVTAYSGERMPRTEFIDKARRADILVTTLGEKVDEELLASAKNLKMVANTAVGYDNIDVPACTKAGVIVTNTPGVLDETTADLTFAAILGVARRTGEAERYLRDGKWDGFRLDLLLGTDVHGKTLGLVGCGRIGQRVAARARGFDMKVLYCRRNRLSEEQERELAVEYVSMDDLLLRSDFVSLHCPLSEETKYLIDKDQLGRMKSSAYLINTSRGAVVNHDALIEALSAGRIAGAALDVFEQEPKVPEALTKMDNVMLLPHIGSATVETRAAMARMAVETVKKACTGRQPENLVNPEIWPKFRQRTGL